MFRAVSHSVFPHPPSARLAMPNAVTLLTLAKAFWFALLIAVFPCISVLAQEPNADGYGGQVYSDTLRQTAPRPPTPFFDTPQKTEEAEDGQSALGSARPEGLEDDYDNYSPTSWWVYYGQTPAQVSSLLSTDKARLIDLQVDSFSPYTFTVTMVANTGAYGKAWWWYYGLTAAQVSSELTNNKARPISLKAYDIGNGQIRFAVVMIANAGADKKSYWWYYGESVSGLSSLLSANNARLITVDPYSVGRSTLYTAVMVSDTGADRQAWWWYINASPATLANTIRQNNARIFYLTNGSDGNFDVIMESCANGCSEWWYYYGVTPAQMVANAEQNGGRMVNFSTYPGCGGTCSVGAMINNSNAITTRVGNLIRNGVGGTEGLFLQKVNGPVLASLEDSAVYEPASSIKVVANLYAMTQVQKGNIKLTTPITHYTNGADSCPNPPVVSGTETLGLALREMMYHSDNTRTREITDHFGDVNINSFAHSIGMTNTSINHYIGCGGPIPDTFSLDNAALLYEGVANQTLLNVSDRGIFYSNMAGRAQYESEGYDWTGIWDHDIPTIINQVAPAGTTAAQKSAYMAAMNVAYKAGNYVLCGSSCSNVVEDIAITGWFQLPTCSASGTTYSEYVWGIFFSNVPNSGWYSGKVTSADNDFTTAKGELLREQIQAGMASCSGKSLEVMTYSPADLVFGSTAVGHSTAFKTITVTNKQLTTVTGIGVTIFGDFSETNNCPASLGSGKSCTINVSFTPTVAGERTGAVIVGDAGTGEPQTIQLTGTGS